MTDEKTIISNMKLAFNALFRYEKSESLKDIWRDVYGDEYPEESHKAILSLLVN